MVHSSAAASLLLIRMSAPIFQDEVTEERGENARLSAFIGAIAVGDLVKTTLGPKGMDKLLQSVSRAESQTTNDGATILQSIPFQNPAAKVLVNISKVQDEEVGDGTTTVTVLAAELLREAERLVDRKIHPQTIISGYRQASQTARKALAASATDRSADPAAFREDLLAIARTTLSSKILSQDKEHFAQLAVDAVLRLKGSTNLEQIQVISKLGGKLSDSYLDNGFLLEKKFGVGQPKKLAGGINILVANTSMDTDKVKIFGAKFRVDSMSKLADLEKAEKEKMKGKVESVLAQKIDLFVNRQLIYNYPEQLFTEAGVNTIEHADFVGVERLSLVTGGEVASTFEDVGKIKLGFCESVEEINIGGESLLRFSGCKSSEACSIVLRGATEQVLGEARRSLHDALSVLSQTIGSPKTTLGGGCAEMIMADAVDAAAKACDGKVALAIESYANALRQLPTILADNAGYDSNELVAKLRAAVHNGNHTTGLDLDNGKLADMRELGIVESYKLKDAALSSASEAAEMLLRVDNIIKAKPRTADRGEGMM